MCCVKVILPLSVLVDAPLLILVEDAREILDVLQHVTATALERRRELGHGVNISRFVGPIEPGAKRRQSRRIARVYAWMTLVSATDPLRDVVGPEPGPLLSGVSVITTVVGPPRPQPSGHLPDPYANF